MKTPIADRKIELAIRAPAQTMQIVPQERRVHAKPCMDRLAKLGHTVVVRIPQQPEMRNAGEIDIPLMRHHSGRQPIQNPVEASRKNGRTIRPAVTVGIGQLPDLIGMLGEPLHAPFEILREFLEHFQSVIERFDLQIVFEQKGSSAIFFRSPVEAVLFGDIDAALFIQTDRHGASQLRVVCEQIDFQASGDA